MQTFYQFSSVDRADKARREELVAGRDTAKAETHRLAAMQGIDGNRNQRAAELAAGKEYAPSQSIEAQLSAAKSKWFDYERAIEIQDADAAKKRGAEVNRYLQSVRPTKAIAKFVAALTQAHEALVEFEDVKSNLQRQGLGWHPHSIDFSFEAEAVFGNPRDKGSAFSQLLRTLVAGGHMKAIAQ
jgi:hypothetical protein